MKLIASLLLILGALPLLIYPFVLLANVMSLAGHRSGNEQLGLMAIIAYVFLLGSTAYPFVYLFCLVFAIARMKENKGKAAFGYSIFPICYIAVVVGPIGLWGKFS